MSRDSIAAIVLTKNERANIPRCLSSIPWPQKLVVDSGSTDATLEVARACGAQVLIHVQEGPFNIADQRNWAMASGKLNAHWVLFLDADEELTPRTINAIEEACTHGDTYDAYELTPKYLFWGLWLRRTQGYPNWHPRLVKNVDAPFEGGVWENFRSDLRVGRLDEPYNHYAFSKGLSDWLERHDRYSTWDSARIYEFLKTGKIEDLGTTRKLRLRRLAARFWPIRPLIRFLNMYFYRGGFLEGIPGFVYSVLCMFYEFMTVIKINEHRRISRGLPL